MRRIFIGYDPNETVALYVLMHSIMRHASEPVQITPLVLRQLPMTRPRDHRQSTEFAFSRFLVPWLCGFKGRAAFMDCDMLCRADIEGLFVGSEEGSAVSVVQHDYTPAPGLKFLGQAQSRYERKNWSSVMVFDCELCQALTPEYVNTATGLDLHQFRWVDDARIGQLDPAWNHLVGECASNPAARLVHFTLGTPCFAKFSGCEFAEEWRDEWRRMIDHNPRGEYSLPERASA